MLVTYHYITRRHNPQDLDLVYLMSLRFQIVSFDHIFFKTRDLTSSDFSLHVHEGPTDPLSHLSNRYRGTLYLGQTDCWMKLTIRL